MSGLPERSNIEMPSQGCEQQRAEMQLRNELSRANEGSELVRRNQLDFDSFFRASRLWTGLDKERMDGVRQACGARRVAAEHMYALCRVSCFLQQLSPARFLSRLALFDRARREFPGECLYCGPELPDDRKRPVRRARDDRNIVALSDGVVQFGSAARIELDATLDDFHPR